MKTSILARLMAAGAMLAAAAGAAPAQALKPWKHGIIAPKADAGFLLMAAKRGFAEREGLKLELLEVKDDQIGLKALLAGELDSYEGGAQGAIAAGVRGGDVKIMGCHWIVVPHGIMVKAGIDKMEDLKGKSIAVFRARLVPRHVGARGPGEIQDRLLRRQTCGGWWRSRSLHCAARRGGRRRGGVERVFAAGVVAESENAAGGQGCAAEFPAYLHVFQR